MTRNKAQRPECLPLQVGVEGARGSLNITASSYAYPFMVAEDVRYAFEAIPAQLRPCLLRPEKEDDSRRVQLVHRERSSPSRSWQPGPRVNVRADGCLHLPAATIGALRRLR